MRRASILALDAMGGDHAPDIVVSGASLALKQRPESRFLFFGRTDRVGPLVHSDASLSRHSSLIACAHVIAGDAKPALALRSSRGTSMRKAIEALGEGKADGVVSAGNTGALMAIARAVLKTLPGIDRPAICKSLPTRKGSVAMLDLGANLHCSARNLVQFAVLGLAFAQDLLKADPAVFGLLNVGEEESKGNKELQEAARILYDSPLQENFCGFVEGDDILRGTTDVVVTDGFSGNVALKMAEGTASLTKELLLQAFSSSWRSRLGYFLARPALLGVHKRLDARRYNGAMLLGLNGIVVKSHGGTDAIGFANAITAAQDMFFRHSSDRIARRLSALPNFG